MRDEEEAVAAVPMAQQREEQEEASSSFTFCGLSKHYIAAENVEEVYGKWKKPDVAEAELRYHDTHTHHDTFDVKTPVKEFKEFGPGHMLYFYFLKWMGIVFCCLAIMPASFQLSLYFGGEYFAAFSDIDKASLGDYGLASSNSNSSQLNITLPITNKGADAQIAILQLFLEDGSNPPVKMSSLGVDKRQGIIAISVLDLISTVGYLGFCLFFVLYTRRLADKADENTTTIHDYSVRARHVPPDATADEVQKYFEQWGQVVMVELARKCDELIQLVLERGKVIRELDRATALLQRTASLYPKVDEELEMDVHNLKYDLSLLTEAIKARQFAQGGADVVEAYVTYIDDRGRDECLAAQPKGLLKHWSAKPEQRFRGTHALLITHAPEPEDIKFENLEKSEVERFGRRSATLALKILVVLVGFTLVSLAPAIKRNLSTVGSAPSEEECDASCTWRNPQGALFLNDTMRTMYKTCYETGVLPNAVSCTTSSICYECFCKTSFQQSDYSVVSYCNHFQSVLFLVIGSQGLTVVSIVVVNMTVAWIMAWLTSVERHHTRSKEATSLMMGLFFTQYVNSAFSTVLANMYLPRALDRLGDSWVAKVFLGGIYADVTPDWYRDVGKSLYLGHLLGLPIRLGLIALNILKDKWRRSGYWKALTQAELNHAFEGHKFEELARRYGEHLTVIFVALTYSSSMPLFLWTVALSFVSHFWVEKYELLKVCQRPHIYSSDVAQAAAALLPFAVLWHLAAGMWMYSIIGVQRSPLVGEGGMFNLIQSLCTALNPVWSGTSGLTAEQEAARLSQASVAHLFYALFIFALLIFVFFTLRMWANVFRSLAKATGLKKQPAEGGEGFDEEAEGAEHKHGVPEFPVAVRSKLLIGPDSYDVRKNPYYVHAFVRMEDLLLDEQLLAKVEARERERDNQLLPLPSDAKRARRRQRAREALDKNLGALKAAGEISQMGADRREQRRLHTPDGSGSGSAWGGGGNGGTGFPGEGGGKGSRAPSATNRVHPESSSHTNGHTHGHTKGRKSKEAWQESGAVADKAAADVSMFPGNMVMRAHEGPDMVRPHGARMTRGHDHHTHLSPF